MVPNMNILIQETGAEILKIIRAPEYLFPTLLLPSIFYMVFGIMLRQNINGSAYLLATYGVFAVMGPTIFGFGSGVANERERGWLDLKRALPVPAYSYICAKLVTTILVCCFALMPIYLIAGFFGEVTLNRHDWFALFGVHISTVIPFTLIGLSLGFSLSSSGATAFSNIIFLSLALLGGLWFPVFMFPEFMQTLANFMPSFHMAELALSIVESPTAEFSTHQTNSRSIAYHLGASISMTTIFLVLTFWAWLRQRTH